jgi:uncharacterized repeat protein (TIGR01451 family)
VWRSWKTGRLLVIAAALCAVAGCTSSKSCIDPSGERLFTSPPPPANYNPANERYFDDPMGRLPSDDVAVQLRPQELVAPVGSEVVLIAGVCGPDGYLRTNRRLEWTVAPGSVGHFVAIEKGSGVDLLVGDFNWPRKVDATFAVGSTSRSNVRLNRGACVPETNVLVLRGEGWITVTSPVEGTSNVTVLAPEVYQWNARLRSAMVHWVDALPQYPPPSISPAGTRHVFTTTVTRHSNQSPCEGWRVRYEISGGPPAGFCPDGVAVMEVPTNSAGQASVEIMQKQPAHGTNKICIQVIRPGDLPGAGGKKLVVGTGSTTQSWTAPDLAVHVSGPPVASVGATLGYRIAVSNPGDLPAKDVVATDAVPDGLTYISSNPAAESTGRQLRWQLGELGPRQQRQIEVNFRAERQGSVTNCCEATAAGGLKVSECAATTVAAPGAATTPPPAAGTPSVDVQISGPARDTVAVGSEAAFQITVINRGPSPLVRARMRDRFDPGLEHKNAPPGTNLIDGRLDDLPPGQSQPISVKFRVTKPGRLCHVVEITTQAGVVLAKSQACVMAVGEPAGPGPSAPVGPPPSGPQPSGPQPAPLTIKVTGPKQLAVGELARFFVEVTNKGTATLRNIKVADRSDAAFDPEKATDGWQLEGSSLVWIIDNLPAGESRSYEVQCTGRDAAAKACNRATATLPDGTRVEDEACVEIRGAAAPAPTPPKPVIPPAEGLTLSVVGLTNPIRAGREMTYEIVVNNKGAAVVRQIAVTATVPDGMMPVKLGTVGPATGKVDRQTVRFDAVPELRPGASLSYSVRVQAQQPGPKSFRAELRTAGSPEPVVKEEKTDVEAK